MKALLVLFVAFFAGCGLASAEELIPMSPELKAFLSRPDEQKRYLSKMTQQWNAVVEGCPSPHINHINVIVIDPPSFDKVGNPVSGVWRIISRYEGCGQNRLLSVMYGFTPEGKIGCISLLPGTTATDSVLQRDSLMYARLGMANLVSTDCKDVRYIDTKFIDFGEASPLARDGHEKRSWTEEWTVKACGITGVVEMHFIPDATGTTISSRIDNTRKISPN